MKISTKGRYGLRLMVELALVYRQRLLPLKEVAKNQDISDKYLEQIIAPLGKSGLVVSVRGAQGGYALSRDPSEITVRDVLRAVEGGMALVDCLGDGCERKAFAWLTASGSSSRRRSRKPRRGLHSRISSARRIPAGNNV